LFAGVLEAVFFSGGGGGVEMGGLAAYFLRDTALGADDGDHLVALVAQAFDARCNIADAVEAADGGASVFLNNQCHADEVI
jgi:hypothetical protein